MIYRLLACSIASAFAFSTLPAADSKPVHLFILSGQSNMAGMKPENGFVQEANKLFGEGQVKYIKVARGGQPIRLWLSEWDEIAKTSGLEPKGAGEIYYQQILKALKAIQDEHDKFASVTFCWMQGERDAKELLGAAYEASIKKLIANLRRDLQAPEMNVVLARLSDYAPKGKNDWDKVKSILQKVAEDDPHGAWVDTDDLNDKKGKNDLHYTKEGYQLLGERYARQAHLLANGKEPDPKGRPE
jgi:hypothetical protein